MIGKNDTEAARRRVDEQDRLDAEENMVTAMAVSVSSNRSVASSNRSVASSNVSVSSKRRSRPPAIPPPPLGKSPSRASSSSSSRRVFPKRLLKATMVAVLVASAVSVGTLAVVKGNIHLGVSSSGKALFSSHHGKRPVLFGEGHVHRIQHTKHTGVAIPPVYQSHLKSFHEQRGRNEIPILWRIPQSGDEAISRAIGECLDFVQAGDQTELLRHSVSADTVVEVLETPKGNYVNIDFNNRLGIELARSVQLISMDIVNTLTSPHLHVIELMQDEEHSKRGRLFAVFRQPVERLVSYYEKAKDADSRYYDADLKGKSLQEYADWPTDRPEFNFMVKSLVSSGDELISSAEITVDDLKLAKAILKEKVLALSTEDKYGSWAKLATWQGWKTTQDQRTCVDRILQEDWPGHDDATMNPQSPISIRLSQRASWDTELFRFAMDLYRSQTEALLP